MLLNTTLDEGVTQDKTLQEVRRCVSSDRRYHQPLVLYCGSRSMLAAAFFLSLCTCAVLVAGAIHDFDDTQNGYEFIYHDNHDLLLTIHNDTCYFIRYPDRREGDLVDTDEGYNSWHQHHPSSLQFAENSLIHHLRNNRSGDVMQSTLADMRAKFDDVLANFHCMDKHVFDVLLWEPPSQSAAQTTPRPDTTQQPTGGRQPVEDVYYSCRGLPSGKYPYAANCHRYLDCTSGMTFVRTCGPGLAFLINSLSCVMEAFVGRCYQ